MGEINCSKKLKTSEVNVVDATFAGFVVPNGKTLNYVLEYFNSQINGLISSSNPITVKDEGSSLTSNLSSLNFTGPGVTASAVGNDITVNITGGGSVTGTPNYSARYNSLGLLSTGVIQDDNHRVGVNTTPNSDVMMSVLTTFETYAIQLRDGTQGAGKFLKSITADGEANWANITASDVLGAVAGSGTTNYLAKFTSSGTIGDSLIQDNGSTIGIGTNPSASTKLFVSSDVNTSAWFRSNKSNSSYGQGVIGEASGSTNYFNIGVEGRSVSANLGGSNIGGWFRSSSGSLNYSVQLQDGTEGLGKFLKSVTSDGRANWANITTADISGAIVSSVGLSMPSAFSVSNSPITGSGTISVTGSGTTSQYVRGDGTLATFPTALPTSNVKHSVKYAEALTIGQAVYVSSANGTNMLVSKADNSSEATSSKTMGLVTSTGATNYIGEVITEGLLTGLDTSTATAGDAVWLGTNGNLIFWHYGGSTTKPVAPAHLVFIGIVTRVNANNGEIFVKVQNGFEIDELHDVSVVGRANNTLLGYNSSTSLHEFKTISTWLGFTPANKAGDTFTGAVSATNLSGTNTGDETTATIKTKLGAASSSTDGYLTSADWSTFNGKVDGSGTANYVSKFTASGTIGNSLIRDDGATLGIGTPVDSGIKLKIYSDKGVGFNVTEAKSGAFNTFGIVATASGATTGASNKGIQGNATGNTFLNVGVGAQAYGASAENIGIWSEVSGATANYSLKLIDGTQGLNKFLKSVTADGKANWATLTVADTGLALTTTGTSGAATLVGNTLNIPQYTGGTSSFDYGISYAIATQNILL